MATSSITKEFIIDSDEVADRLIAALEDKSPKPEICTNYYEEGKKSLEKYFGHYKK